MPLRNDLLTPIPGDNPSGTNLRYDPVVDKIKEARREDIEAPQGDWVTTLKTADHPLVIKLAGEVIAKRSKDLQLAVWLVDSHVKKERFPIIGQCFGFIHDLLANFWDTLYPELEEDDLELRATPLEWLGNKLEEPIRRLPLSDAGFNYLQYKESRLVGYEADTVDSDSKIEARNAKIKDGKLTPEDFDAATDQTSKAFYQESVSYLESALNELEALKVLCEEKFGYDAPTFSKTRGAIEDVKGVLFQILVKKGGPEAVEAPPVAIEDEFSSFLNAGPSTSSSSSVESDFSFSFDSPPPPEPTRPAAAATPVFAPGGDVAAMLAQIGKQLRSKNPDDPAGYFLLRGYRFGELWYDAPPVKESRLEAPPTELRVRLRRALANREWDELLEATEEAMAHPSSRCWLDLQRMSVQALEARQYVSAANAITSFVKSIALDLPDLIEATLDDGTPTASAETKEWIAKMMPAPGAASASAAPGTAGAPASDDFSFDSFSFDTPAAAEEPAAPAAESSDFDFSFDEPAATPAAPAAADTSSDFSFELPDFKLEDEPPILVDMLAFPEETILLDEFGRASKLVKEGKAADGLRMITELLAVENTGRKRFRRRTQLAHLLLLAGHRNIATALLNELEKEIETRKLEDWEEAEAVAYPLELLIKCTTGDSEQAERRSQLFARLSRIDPVRAMNCAN